LIKRKNFTKIALADIPLDTLYDSCNFSRRAPDMTGADPTGHQLFPGYSGPPITFRDCNLINVKPPLGSILEFCNTALIEYDLVDRDETLVINGVERGARRRFYKRRIHGRMNPQTLSDEILPTPQEYVKARPNRR
jgi:hypothetical protein